MRRHASPLFHLVPSRPPPVPAALVFFSIASIEGPIFNLTKHDILSLFVKEPSQPNSLSY